MSKFSYDAPYRLPLSWDEYRWMNTSLMRFNNQELKDEYIRQYYHHKDMLSDEDFYDCWPDIIIEQKFLTLLCEEKHYSSEPIIPNFWFDDNANDFALNIGFTHLGHGKHAHRDWIIDLLSNENPELFIGTINDNFEQLLENAKTNKMIQTCFSKELSSLQNKVEQQIKIENPSFKKCNDICSFCDYICKNLSTIV
jgi:hypothetical protein